MTEGRRQKKPKRDQQSRNSTISSSPKFKYSIREKAVEEKLRVAELIAEASFMKKKRNAENQAEVLRMKEDFCKSKSKSQGI